MDIPICNTAGQVTDHLTVDEEALGGKPNMALIRQAVLMYEANQRLGTAQTRSRHAVAGSGRKPWIQKHTGRARHGTRTSPIFVGGGIAHGRLPRDFRQKMNRKARQRAVSSAFLAKAQDGEVIIVDELSLPEAKTREMASVLKSLGVDRTFLVVLEQHDGELWRCTRNIRGGAMTTWSNLNVYEMIRPRRVIFTLGAAQEFLKRATGKSAPDADAKETAEVADNG